MARLDSQTAGPLPEVVPPTYRRTWAGRLWYGFVARCLWLAFKIFWRLRYEGTEHVPTNGAVVVVANHASHLDPPLIGATCPRQIAYLARKTLFKGVLGSLIRSLDAIPIDRDGSALGGIKATLKRLRQGDAILVFPEGQRAWDGELGEFEPGFLSLVRRGKAALMPVGIIGAYHAMPRGKSLPRPSPIAVVYGEPISNEQLVAMTDAELLGLARERINACCERARELRR